MEAVLINTTLAFIEGLALILSPCILPVLPIILSGAAYGGKQRPLGIIVGFVLMFTLVTLFSRLLVVYVHLSSEMLRDISYIILLALGLTMISTYLTEKFSIATAKLTGFGAAFDKANNPQSGFAGGVLFGCLVGVIWTPCAGPILAAVIVQAVVQHTTFASVIVVSAFAIGTGVPMLLLALLGRQLLNSLTFIREHTVLIRKLLGCLIVFSVIFLVYSTNLALAVSVTDSGQTSTNSLVNGLEQPYPAPAISGIDAWINTAPITLAQLRGKVVLVDFWTYSCINCIRTLPHLKEWYDKYHRVGFEIVGIHSPEFEFERNIDNVKNAVKKFGIRYPVGLDNHFVTWQNFHNQFWPAHYLINKKGEVVYEHFGEGEYDVTENNIRYLLGLNGVALTSDTSDYFSTVTPETYFGYARAKRFVSPVAMLGEQVVAYHYPANLPQDHWALQGEWLVGQNKITAANKGAAIKLHFKAKTVYAVMGAAKSVVVKVVSNQQSAARMMTVQHNQLYTVLDLPHSEEGEVEITATAPGLEMYTFTFGS